jgi:hypothetical protein
LNKKQEALLMSLSDAKKQQTTDLAALNVELKEAESSLKDAMKLKEDAERVLASTTSVKYIQIRTAQVLDAENMLRVLALLESEGGEGSEDGKGDSSSSSSSGKKK